MGRTRKTAFLLITGVVTFLPVMAQAFPVHPILSCPLYGTPAPTPPGFRPTVVGQWIYTGERDPVDGTCKVKFILHSLKDKLGGRK